MRKSLFTAIAAPLAIGALLVATAAVGQQGRPLGAAAVDFARQLAADNEPGSWMSAGRTYDEQRYSPLTQINVDNVRNLGLAWYGDVETDRGQEATPVVVDGVLYITTAWSHVKAYNAKTGEKLWEYDPKVDPSFGRIACCDVVNRGVAVWKGKVYLGALDGRLIALDGRTGKVVWETLTVDHSEEYTITGVPRIVKDKVIIGNGGAEYGVRGYVTAYDAETGKQLWRFFTVPGNPADGFETPEMEMAAKTWTGEWWKLGGGGTVWDGMVYDVETGLFYIGVGNGSPWNQKFRSPGGGDNLFLTSIIALDPDTGKYVWHYQTSPGETWDHTATQPLMVATLKIDGRDRRVVMEAPKNGFFYVLDAKTGELISAEKFADVNWASHIDKATGRPVENPAARYSDTGQPAIVSPGALGAHNWHPMAYSPRTGLVYIPVTENNGGYANPAEFKVNERSYNTAVNMGGASTLYNQPGAPKRGNVRSYISAYNPVTQKEAWRIDNEVYGASGILATAGNLIFSGNHAGEFVAYRADNGQRLWSAPTQARVVAAPSTYMIDGEQYVAILVGARGLPDGVERTSPTSANNSRILVFKLGANGKLPDRQVEVASTISRTLNPPLLTGTNEQVFEGQNTYGRLCAGCHGQNAVADKSIPDVRYSTTIQTLAAWNEVVVGGSRAANGMPSFKDQLGPGESEAIWHYVVSRANQDKAAEDAAARSGG